MRLALAEIAHLTLDDFFPFHMFTVLRVSEWRIVAAPRRCFLAVILSRPACAAGVSVAFLRTRSIKLPAGSVKEPVSGLG